MDKPICTTAIDAVEWVKSNRKLIQNRFASISTYPAVEKPFSIFMAGAPGVGKTEFSKSFLEVYHSVDKNNKIVRIDTDEVREMIPGYNGENASLFQRAAALGIEYVIDYAQYNSQNICVDTTFGSLTKANQNISRAIGRNRNTGIFYLYQDPRISWE